jgi:hypothetical protein
MRLKYPTCDVCGLSIMVGKAFQIGDYCFCEKCVKKEVGKLAPMLRDVVEDFLYDYRTDCRELIEEEEDEGDYQMPR